MLVNDGDIEENCDICYPLILGFGTPCETYVVHPLGPIKAARVGEQRPDWTF
jgi:hypothetical protein